MADPLGLIPNAGHLGPTSAPSSLSPRTQGPAATASFKEVLLKNIEQVNRLQQDAETAIEDLASGRRDDVDQVLMAKKKADLAFQMLLQVRNKLMDAYEEIKQMRV